MAAISTLMACMSTDRSNVELLRDLAERFSAAVIGVCAKQLSMHSSVLAIGPGEPRGHELDKFRERLAIVEAEFCSALSMVNNLQWRAQMTAGPTSHYLAGQARAADLLVAASDSDVRKVSASSEIDVSDLHSDRRPTYSVGRFADSNHAPTGDGFWNHVREWA